MMSLFAAAMLMLAPQSAEWLAMPMPEGFVVGHQQTAMTGTIEERIPRGETVHDWTRMITLLRIDIDVPVATYLASYVERVIRACPGAKAAPQATATLNGRAATGGRVDCPLNPATGKPETFLYRILNADGSLHMAQVAFRRVPSGQDVRWAQAQLGGVILCRASSAEPACKR